MPKIVVPVLVNFSSVIIITPQNQEKSELRIIQPLYIFYANSLYCSTRRTNQQLSQPDLYELRQ